MKFSKEGSLDYGQFCVQGPKPGQRGIESISAQQEPFAAQGRWSDDQERLCHVPKRERKESWATSFREKLTLWVVYVLCSIIDR